MPWIQTYTPAGGSLGLSALIAAIPLVVIFVCLAVLKMKAHKAGPLAVASAIGTSRRCRSDRNQRWSRISWKI